jgi:hypothetical protein
MQTGPQGIVVGLTEPVTFDPNAFMLSNLTTGGAITQLTHLNAGSTPSATHIWRVETIGDNNVAGALPRGNYEIAINKDRLPRPSGRTISAASSSSPPTSTTTAPSTSTTSPASTATSTTRRRRSAFRMATPTTMAN